MAKRAIDEVEVVRFFETGSIDRAEVVFNIISEKMRERLRGTGGEKPAIVRKRRTETTPASGSGEGSQ
jgi:hypothetical protein